MVTFLRMVFAMAAVILLVGSQLFTRIIKIKYGGAMFGKKRISELDALFESLEMNKSNNYKDAAKKDYEEICAKLEGYQASGEFSGKTLKPYMARMMELAPVMENYNHQNNVKSF